MRPSVDPSEALRYPERMESLLEIRDLQVQFPSASGALRAVDGVSISVRKGEAVAVVGESGCGKSLTALSVLRLISSPGKIAGGSILLEGRDILQLPEKEMCAIRGSRIAMIFQEPMTALNPVLTVGFQIAEAVLAHERISKKEARVRSKALLSSVAMPDPDRVLNAYPHQLSGGQRQRAMIAMALACRPDLLLADEPTTALDVTLQAQFLDLLDQLRQDLGLAVLLITHDLGVVARFAQRVFVMYCGRVVEEARVADIFTLPRHPYTRGLLASVPRHGSRERLLAIPGSVPPLSGLPPGCAFAPRCAFVQDSCCEAVPPLESAGEGRKVRCIRWREVSP